MPSPETEEEATDVPLEEEEEDDDEEEEEEDEEEDDGDGDDDEEEEEEELVEEGHGGARAFAGAAAEAEENGVEAWPPAGPTCCVCMEPWTCYNAHRICCIPCGHVYGRSCLERWLDRSGGSSAKCPQCGIPFARIHIINLYAPGNLWDGCCRVQELKAHYDAAMAKVEERQDKQAKRMAKLESMVGDNNAKFLLLTQLGEKVVARIKTEFGSMKEQMKTLVEQNATPMDLVGFMERNCTKLWDWIPFESTDS
ncbi:hypothetical protein ACP70R_012306 [Stipagrostis hirtigluma subsp. patula]